MPSRALKSVICAAVVATAMSGAADAQYPMVYYLEFAERPTPEQILAVTPPELRGRTPAAVVRMRCQIGADGKLGSCLVAEQRPESPKLGQAAARLAPLYRVPSTTDTGSWTEVIVHFGPPWHSQNIPPPLPLPPGPGAQARPSPPKPVWVRMPSGEDVSRVYPQRAEREGARGRVTLSCTVTADGGLTACEVLSESPAGYGFGEAALKLTPLMGMKPTTEDGQSVDGATVIIPLSFTPPE